MDKKNTLPLKKILTSLLLICFIIGYSAEIRGFTFYQNIESQQNYKEYKGFIVDAQSNKRLEAATISVTGTNISTVTNDDGEFSIKVPADGAYTKLTVSYLGYKNKDIDLPDSPDSKLK